LGKEGSLFPPKCSLEIVHSPSCNFTKETTSRKPFVFIEIMEPYQVPSNQWFARSNLPRPISVVFIKFLMIMFQVVFASCLCKHTNTVALADKKSFNRINTLLSYLKLTW